MVYGIKALNKSCLYAPSAPDSLLLRRFSYAKVCRSTLR